MPRSATPKIGASLSLLIAMMFFEPFMPTMCWVAPGDAGGDVDGRLDDLAGLADLVAVRHPAGVDDRPRRAGRALEQLGERLDHLVLRGLAEAAAAGHDDVRLVELRTRVLLDVDGLHLRRRRWHRGRAPARRRPRPAPPPAGSAAKLFGRKATRYGPAPVNVVVTSLVPPNTGVVTLHACRRRRRCRCCSSAPAVELDRQAAEDVAALVVLREQDEVGRRRRRR